MSSEQSVLNRAIVTGGLIVATLMNTLDTTIANVALPHIQGSISASQDQITWVLTSYIVATAIMTPLSGWLALKIGIRQMFLISVGGFIAASVLCGIATSLPEIVAFRLLQGFAGAALMPLSQAAMLELWSMQAVPRVMSIWSAVVMAGPILGPTIGGYLTENYSWRWAFYINVPVGAAAFAAVFLFMSRGGGGKARRFDMIGFVALALFTAAFQLMVDRGPGQDWFDSREIWTEALLALGALYVFVTQSLTADQPFFPRDVMGDRNFICCAIFAFFVFAVQFASSALLPTFMQVLLGYSAMQSGTASMARGLGSLAAFILVPWLARAFGPRPVIATGAALCFLGLWQMAHFDLMMNVAPIEVAGAVQGFGAGLIFNPLSVLTFATLVPGHRTEAAVLSNVVRTLGGSLGIAVAQAMLIRQSATAHEGLASRIIPSDPIVRWSIPQIIGDGGGLERLNAEVTRQGAMIGYDAIFGWMAVGCLFLLPLLVIMRPPKSRAPELAQAMAE